MSYEIEPRSDNDVVEIKHMGTVRYFDAYSATKAASNVMTEFGIRRLIINLQEAVLSFSTMDIFDFQNKQQEIIGDDGITAWVIASSSCCDENLQFAEKVAESRNLPFKCFHNDDEAVEWLASQN